MTCSFGAQCNPIILCSRGSFITQEDTFFLGKKNIPDSLYRKPTKREAEPSELEARAALRRQREAEKALELEKRLQQPVRHGKYAVYGSENEDVNRLRPCPERLTGAPRFFGGPPGPPVRPPSPKVVKSKDEQMAEASCARRGLCRHVQHRLETTLGPGRPSTAARRAGRGRRPAAPSALRYELEHGDRVRELGVHEHLAIPYLAQVDPPMTVALCRHYVELLRQERQWWDEEADEDEDDELHLR